MFEALITEGRRDARRPWLRQTTGGLLVSVVLAALVGAVVIDLLRG
jgi:hypothetical protein